jgi:hypothetical protein
MIGIAQAKTLLATVLAEVTKADGSVALERFGDLRTVDAKVCEIKMVLREANATTLADAMEADEDFTVNSRRVRLAALANYCSTGLRFLEGGAIQSRTRLYRAPDLTVLTSILPNLEPIIQNRWLEAQRCQHARAYLASVVLMGSILEALLLARTSISPAPAYQARAAPKNRDGSSKALHEWTLHHLIEVAVEVGWLKTDRAKFGHALRESRNVVQPYEQVRSGANFDEHTCKTSWHVLTASVEDLLSSI